MFAIGGGGFDPAAPGAIGGTTPAAITGTTITATTQFLAADGSAGTVSYGFADDPDTGIFSRSVGVTTFSNNGISVFELQAGGYAILPSTATLSWTSGAIGTSGDAYISRYAAKQLMISGDGTGATTNAGWRLGYSGDSGSAALGPSTATTLSGSNFAIYAAANATYIGSSNGGSVYITPNGSTNKSEWNTTAGHGLAITAGTATTDVAALSITRTNNNAAVATGVDINIVDTLSNAAYIPFQMRNGATNLFKVSKAGLFDAPAYAVNGGAGASGTGTVISAITVVNGLITAITVA